MITPKSRSSPRNSRNSEKCVCDICTCGEHRCPEPGFATEPFEGITTNQQFYKPHQNFSPPKSFSPSRNPFTSGNYPADIMNTTYKTSYSPPKHDAWTGGQKPERKWANYSKVNQTGKSEKFQGESEYKNKYTNKEISPDNSFRIKKNSEKMSPLKFEGTTTYTAEYSPKKAQSPSPSFARRKPVVSPVKQESPFKNKGPFQGTTTYKDNFPVRKLQSSPGKSPSRADRTYQPSPFKLEGQTSYNTSYRPYTTQMRKKCAVDNLPRRPNRCSPGKRHLNYSPEKNKWS